MTRAAVLTISDSVFLRQREDASGPAVKKRLEDLGWEVIRAAVLPDELEQIATMLVSLAESGEVSAIFTTGGTGMTPRVVTPEATRAVIDREAPGIAECIRAEGRKSNPNAILSRGVAGSRGSVLIINLPGSPRGAVDSLNAIVEVVPHALELLRGNTEHAVTPKPAQQA